MKKKRFYNNKKRNTKWTEHEQGRKIYFADKYIEGDNQSDKFDNRRRKDKKPVFTKDKMMNLAKWLVLVVGCFVVISIGYTVMDVYIDRNAMPLTEEADDSANNGIGNVTLRVRGCEVDPLTMDNSVLLGAVIDSVQDGGYSGISFDVKRDDGTIGYISQLAAVDMYGAQSSPAGDTAGSVSQFAENDILPIARVSCYKDNVFAAADSAAGITADGELYKDSNGNAYLNPDDENVYNYIKGIIEEVHSMGVTVFVLDNCDLPEEIAEGYNDGFAVLSEKLSKDFGADVKFLNGVHISISAKNAKSAEKEWTEKTENINADNVLFYISAKDMETVKDLLDSKENINYIITE